MEDKIIMDTVLALVKNSCDLLMHGAIESGTEQVESTFESALTKTLEIQSKLYKEMENAGIYTVEETTESKIKKVRSKYESTLQNE